MDDRQYKELSIKEFTKAADIYDSGHAGIYEMCKDDYPPILDELREDDFADLLDVGCGTGPMIELLASECPGKNYTGLDLTPRMIEVANAKGLENARFVVGDAEALPFEDESFDVVICANSFHHYPNPQAFFNEAARVLRPGGKLVLRDYTSAAPVIWLMNHVEMPLANLFGHGDVRSYTLEEVRSLCTACGLVPRKLEAQRKFRLHLVARKPTSSEQASALQFGDVQETALVTLAIRASETTRPKPRIRDEKAAEIVDSLGVDVSKYDPFLSHEGVVARTIMFADALRALIQAEPDAVCVNLGCGFDERSYSEEMRKHTVRGRLFAATIGRNMNNRLALFAW